MKMVLSVLSPGVLMTGFLLTLMACTGSDGSSRADSAVTEDTAPSTKDADGDGVVEALDCDDTNPDAHPGAVEVCDGADNDCDGEVDDGYDNDDDGSRLCDGDCDDSDAATWPGAAWLESATDCMTDGDGDGFGEMSPAQGVTAGTDCNDSSATTWPGAASSEVPAGCMTDNDGDGYGSSAPLSGGIAGTDCDDEEATLHPNAEELCDGKDNDCDGTTDEDVSCTNIGNYEPFEEIDTIASGYLLGTRITLPPSPTIDKFGLYAASGSTTLKMALYTDIGGQPGDLQASVTSASFSGTGHAEFDISDVTLSSGTYWLVAIFNSAAEVGYLPDPYGDAQTYTGQAFNFYVVLSN